MTEVSDSAVTFTRGPWDLLEYPDGQAFEIEGGGCVVAVVHYDEGANTKFSEARANARLMTHSPELAELIADYVAAWEDIDDSFVRKAPGLALRAKQLLAKVRATQ